MNKQIRAKLNKYGLNSFNCSDEEAKKVLTNIEYNYYLSNIS